MKISPLPPVQPTGSTLVKDPFGAVPVYCVKFWFSRPGRFAAQAPEATSDMPIAVRPAASFVYSEFFTYFPLDLVGARPQPTARLHVAAAVELPLINIEAASSRNLKVDLCTRAKGIAF